MQPALTGAVVGVLGVGMTIVIISGGIDLSVGAIYALAGVAMAMVLRALPGLSPVMQVVVGLTVCLGTSLLCGLANGIMVIRLRVHPFIVTLGTMWMLRGVAFVVSHAESVLVPSALTHVTQASLGLRQSLYPVPFLLMVAVTIFGMIYLGRTVMGRHVFALGGNAEASRYSGLNVDRITLGVYVLSGLTAGIAAFIGASFYGSANSSDGTGYELYVIAAAVVGGALLASTSATAIPLACGGFALLGLVLYGLSQVPARAAQPSGHALGEGGAN